MTQEKGKMMRTVKMSTSAKSSHPGPPPAQLWILQRRSPQLKDVVHETTVLVLYFAANISVKVESKHKCKERISKTSALRLNSLSKADSRFCRLIIIVAGFTCSDDISKEVCLPDNYSKLELPHTGNTSK